MTVALSRTVIVPLMANGLDILFNNGKNLKKCESKLSGIRISEIRIKHPCHLRNIGLLETVECETISERRCSQHKSNKETQQQKMAAISVEVLF